MRASHHNKGGWVEEENAKKNIMLFIDTLTFSENNRLTLMFRKYHLSLAFYQMLLGFPILSILLQQKYEQTKVNRYSPNVRQIHLFPEPRRAI